MQMLRSNWLSQRKQSIISAGWFDLIDKMATFPRFSMFSEAFETQMDDQIPGKTAKRRRRSRLLEL